MSKEPVKEVAFKEISFKDDPAMRESEVALLNPDDVKDYIYNVGKFASICRDDSNVALARPVYERIGLSCLNSGHWSPARAVYWKFNIAGISRVASHQLVRHSVGVEINQQSQRSIFPNKASNVIPLTIINNIDAMELFIQTLTVVYESFNIFLKLGIPLEDARYILPNCAVTGMNIAITPQALFHFFNERLCSKAQWEIRGVAEQMKDLILAIEPRLDKFTVPKCEVYNKCTEVESCGRFQRGKLN